MRLFYQLSEQEQESVINYCMNHVLNDLIDAGLEFGVETEKDLDIKEKIDAALKKVKKIKSRSEKIKILMEDDTVKEAVYAIATEMAKNAYYHQEDELVIFPEALKDEDQLDLIISKPKEKKSNLN